MTLPSGTVTFLFTDIEGSTKRWESHPVAMQKAVGLHDRLLREVIASHNGYIFKTVGDAFYATFVSPLDAVLASVDIHCSLLQQDWEEVEGIRVRIGIHTGVAEERDNDYFGPTLNRVARLQALANGQQTLVSEVTYDLCVSQLPDYLRVEDLGQHWLRDLQHPMRVWQINHPNLRTDFPSLRSLRSFPNNLPLQLTSLIGREEVINSIKSLFTSYVHRGQIVRLVTLTGAGGIGKTRLALQVAADLIDEFPDGVWQMDLAALTDESRLIEAIATVLKVRGEHGQSRIDVVIEHCKSRKLLLILDNCEQIIGPVANVVDKILRLCPEVSLLTTSREVLGINGEIRYRVPSLELPDPDHPLVPERLTEFGAIRLFVDRAVAIKPDFALTAQNGHAICQICRRLDGIPLATELAAARIRSMPVGVLASRLEHNFQLLTGGSRVALPRHQTLRALIDWSYDLLSNKERLLFERLSVFLGGLTLEMAEAICAEQNSEYQSEREYIEDWEVLDLLTGLVDKSLLLFEEQEGMARYRLLEPLRQYGWEQLENRDTLRTWQVRHRDYFHKIIIEAKPKLFGSEQNYWFNYLSVESNNIRAALNCYADAEARGLLKDHEATGWMELVTVLTRYWYICGSLTEAKDWIDKVIALDPPAEVSLRIRFHNGAGALSNLMGDRTTARNHYQKALEIGSEVATPYERATTLNNLALVEEVEGNYGRMVDILEEVLSVFRSLDLKRQVAITLSNLGLGLRSLHRLNEAQVACVESLKISKEIDDKATIASVTEQLAELAIHQDDVVIALHYLREAVQIRKEQHNISGLAFCIEWYGIIALREGDYERSLSLLATAEKHRTLTSRKRSPASVSVFEAARTRAIAHLDADRARLAWSRGYTSTIEAAIMDLESL